jgi:excisionase family DNA binding protein
MSTFMADTLDRLMTVEDVMENLRISRPTLYRLLKSHRLVPVRIGKRTLFDPKDIKAFVDAAKGVSLAEENVSEQVSPKSKKIAPKRSPRKQQQVQKVVKKQKEPRRDSKSKVIAKTLKTEAPSPQPTESSDSGQGRLL